MRTLVYGITGFTGRNLAHELVSRGHEVVGVSRDLATTGAVPPGGPRPLPDEVELVEGDVYDADQLAQLAAGADAIVVAVSPISDAPLVDAVPSLLATAASTGARLGVVGGASSLSRVEGGPRLIDEDFPEAWRSGALALIDVLDALRASDTGVDWFFLSPAEHYGAHAAGERRGVYRTGTDVLVTDESGLSHIGGEDYALAFVDELETPQHHAMRFTVGY